MTDLSSRRAGAPPRAFRAGLLAALVVAAVPLFGALGQPDVGSDEAIYSYAVERTLETGDWLTPRGIPSDAAFLEKPPLKIWMVAAGMRAGILPRNETGLRLLDAFFGLAGCVYVYLLGCRLGGPVCGLAAVLTLVTVEPLVFDHGLRSNNMEGALFLAYCGGVFHAARWVEAAPGAGRRDAGAVAGWFALGFLTKFVAALFLPLVVLAAACWRPGGAADLRARWRDWLLPSVLAGAAIVPWFVYQSVVAGAYFWEVILGTHVYQRFAGTLDPNHLAPWHYYVTATWAQMAATGVVLLWAAGTVRLLVSAWRGTPWLSRLVLLWGVLPLALMSLGTSKVLHYAYPFFPALALAAGYAGSWLIAGMGADREMPADPRVRRVRLVLAGGALAGVALALATALEGRLALEAGGIVLFRNSSAWRPAVVAAVLAALAVHGATWRRIAAGALVAALLPLGAYADRLQRLARVAHPIRATRDCMSAVQRDAPASSGPGVLSASGNVLHHSYYYYLWRQGPYVIAPSFDPDAVLARLGSPGPQTPVILRRADYERLAHALPDEVGAARFDDDLAVLFPGRFAPCATAVIAAGGRPIWSDTLAGHSR